MAEEGQPSTASQGGSRAGLELGLALLAMGLIVSPVLIGRGIDVPDDFLYYDVATWEWLRHALSRGVSPWFIPGKLGGVSLVGDTVAMAPFYPPGWVLALLPVSIFLPLVWLAHALATVLAGRWCAGMFGASSRAATLAGLALAAGPNGVIQIMEQTCEGVGRNANELARKIKAAQYVRANPGQVCPAAWEEGSDTLAPSLDLVGKI